MPKICPICNRSYSDDNAFCPADGTTLRADVTGDLIGSVIADRYLVTDLLGEGGMGRVYLGRHVRLPQQAAIKVLRDDLVKDRASIARFNREATSASRIQSEYVARVFDFGETQDNLVYLAMEYVPGRTLRSLIEAEGPLPLPRTATIISQIAEGLDAAHRLGIIHRDLKPDNVIIMTDDEMGDRAKVVDFGIAKGIGGGAEKEGQITSTGFVVGTPDFMSPEQLLNDTIDARSDVYALGLVAYNMLTGVLPFESSTPSKGLMARLVDEPAPLSQSNPRGMWSIDLQQVFDKVLARNVDDRFANAREFAQALREVAGVAAPAWSTVGMSGMAAGVAGATAPRATGRTAAGGSPVAARHAPASAREPQPASVSTPRSRRTLFIAAGSLAGVAALAATVMLLNGAPGGTVDTGVPATPTASTPSPDSLTSLVAESSDTTTRVPVVPDTQRSVADAGAGGGTTAPRPTGNATTPATPPATNVSRPVRGGSITASIDSVREAVDQLMFSSDDATIPREARAQIQRINTLLARASTAGDSARLYLLSANASKLAGEDVTACATLRLLGKMTVSDADRRAADRYHGQWGCNSPWR